jgi:hypothetical protein
MEIFLHPVCPIIWSQRCTPHVPGRRLGTGERGAKVRAQLARPMAVTPSGAVCGTPSARVELVAPDNCPLNASSGPAQCRAASCGNTSQDSGICWSRASLSATVTATLSTPAAPGGSPQAFRPPCASPRSTRPGSMTMQDSARTATLLTAASIGTCPALDTVTVLRTRQEPGPALVAVSSRSLHVPDR